MYFHVTSSDSPNVKGSHHREQLFQCRGVPAFELAEQHRCGPSTEPLLHPLANPSNFHGERRTPCGTFKPRATLSRLSEDNVLESKQSADGGQAGKKKSPPRLFFCFVFFLYSFFSLAGCSVIHLENTGDKRSNPKPPNTPLPGGKQRHRYALHYGRADGRSLEEAGVRRGVEDTWG